MRVTHHMCMSLEGCLRNHRGRKIKIFTNDDGTQSSDKQAREYIAECQAKGWKVIPIGKECEGFDYFGNGCPGHEIIEPLINPVIFDHGKN